jgi:dipeptide/tripeptide permease
LLVATSVPASIQNGAAVPGFFVSIIIIAVGLGGVKACMSPFMGKMTGSMESERKLLIQSPSRSIHGL